MSPNDSECSPLVRTGEPRWWPALGAVVGVGLETKYTILALALGLLAAALATPLRRHLLTPWPWLGAAAALALLAPNLWWQTQHGWISVRFVLAHPQDQASDFVDRCVGVQLGLDGVEVAP